MANIIGQSNHHIFKVPCEMLHLYLLRVYYFYVEFVTQIMNYSTFNWDIVRVLTKLNLENYNKKLTRIHYFTFKKNKF